jgi:hypothetical protein
MSFKRGRDDFDDTIDILHYIIIPEAQGQISHCLQNACSIRIGLGLNCMLPAVELDDEMSLGATEIDDKSVDRKLPSEFET